MQYYRHFIFVLFILNVRADNVLRHIVKRGATLNKEPDSEENIKKVETPADKYHLIEKLENRMHCLEPKNEYSTILANGLLCEPITTVYILKSNVYSCYDLYIPICFYGFLPDTLNPANLTSIFTAGYLNKGYGIGMNGSDAIQKKQVKTDDCILYMR